MYPTFLFTTQEITRLNAKQEAPGPELISTEVTKITEHS